MTGTTITDADRERTRLIRHGNECGHGMWYRIDCDDCISAIIAAAREAGEAKGREATMAWILDLIDTYEHPDCCEIALLIRARGEGKP